MARTLDELPERKVDFMSDYQTIVVPYDFSEHARAALTTAIDLARRLDSDLYLLHVVQLPVYAYPGFHGAAASPQADMAGVRDGAMQSLREIAAAVEGAPGKVETYVVEGTTIVEMIRQSAETLGADLIVMGTHGRTGLAHVFLGSVAERTLRSAPCPVLTVQASEEEKR
jgi:nucleotide-binding universal stress UspA family protein